MSAAATRLGLIGMAVGAALALQALHVPAKAALAQWMLGRAWAQALDGAGAMPVRPWPRADAWPVARLEVAGRGHIVLAGTEGSALAFAPGWMAASAAPGAPGTTVIAAHRDTHFRHLDEIAVGDTVKMALADGRALTYRVQSLEVHDVREQELLLPGDGEYRLVLVTCYPFDAVRPGGPLRYVVRARLLERRRAGAAAGGTGDGPAGPPPAG